MDEVRGWGWGWFCFAINASYQGYEIRNLIVGHEMLRSLNWHNIIIETMDLNQFDDNMSHDNGDGNGDGDGDPSPAIQRRKHLQSR